jgi:hypothetical protein
MPLFPHNQRCDACGGVEERIFTDSYTGKDICLMCLTEVAGRVTNSPESEGDNLAEMLIEADRMDPEDWSA